MLFTGFPSALVPVATLVGVLPSAAIVTRVVVVTLFGVSLKGLFTARGGGGSPRPLTATDRPAPNALMAPQRVRLVRESPRV